MKKTISVFFTSLLFFSVFCPAYAADFFVSPTGVGEGSKNNPWGLQTALDHPQALKPGDTVWLRGGTYGSGAGTLFQSRIKGTEESPIVVRQYAGERATIDGALQVESSSRWVWWWGFEISNSSTERKVPGDQRRGGINLLGRGHKLINLIIHNTGHPAIGYWRPVGDGGEIYGTILWGNGLYDLSDPRFPDGWTRGSAIYAQNETGTRYINEVIAFRNFTTGIKLYTEGGWANGFHLEGNVAFDHHKWNIFGTSKTNAMERLRVVDNYTYRRADDSRYSVQFGYYSGDNLQDATIENNYFVSGSDNVLEMLRWRNIKISSNMLIGRRVLAAWQPGSTLESANWDGNTYLGGEDPAFRLSGNRVSMATWRSSTGFDLSSTVNPLPSQNKIVVRPNKYEPGRAHIIVYNWQNLDSVIVGLSTVGLQQGDRFEIRDAENYFGAPVYQGAYTGQSVSIPMNLTQAAPIVGTVTHFTNTHTPKDFGIYVVLRTASLGDLPGSPMNLRVGD